MNIHVVQQGETIESIAERYGVPVARLIAENGLTDPDNLVIGQCIVIAYPEQTYIVAEGDTLESIADKNDITVLQLIRNNPFLTDREFIYPGETLIISYGRKKGSITTNGYANPFINRNILKKTLPYLSYLSIFGYRITETAEIVDINDSDIIQVAKENGVAPIMMISTFTLQGVGSVESAYNILYNDSMVNRLIDNILSIVRRKGYFGVTMIYQYLTAENQEIYDNLTEKITKRLNREGYELFVSISPLIVVKDNELTFEKIDYSQIGAFANRFIVMNYNWGFNFGPPMPTASLSMLVQFLDYVVTLVPNEKIEIGIPLLGYSWQLPYIIGVTRANALTIDSAINLARDTDSAIQFDEVSKNPFFEYIDNSTGVPRKYIVWFIDARSIDATLDIVTQYQVVGTGAWSIMTFFPQMWLIINSQYEIETIPMNNQ